MHFMIVGSQLLEGDPELCDDFGFMFRAESVAQAMSILRQPMLDFVLVDLTSLSEEGFGFIRGLRAERNDIPLVALTGYHTDDRVRALDSGADDAIAQPVDPGELRARIHAVVRRHKGYNQPMFHRSGLSLSPEANEVRFRGVSVQLTYKEYLILELLLLHENKFVTKKMFLDRVYGALKNPEAEIIDVFMCNLRRKLDHAGAHGVIGTIRGKGYFLRSQDEDRPAETANP